MRRRNIASSPEPTVFRELSPLIMQVFDGIAGHVAQFSRPSWLTHDDVINLCFHEKDVVHLKHVRPLTKGHGASRNPETVLEHNVFGTSPHLTFVVDNNFPAIVPDYAYFGVTKSIPTATPELVTRLGTEIEIWMEHVRNIALAKAVFQFLDKQQGKLTRQNIRYVFPGIVALLRRVHLVPNKKNFDDEAAKWASNLATVLPTWHTALPMLGDTDIRPALALANEVLSSFALYPADTPPQSDVRVVVAGNKFLASHPLWPEPLNLAGL